MFDLKARGQNLDTQEIEYAIRKFNNLIDKNKEKLAYSDFKEGVNKGLDIARYNFGDHIEKFDLFSSKENQTTKIQNLQNEYNLLIDTLKIGKPGCSADCLEGIYEGLEKSKIIFGEFIKEFV
ncbi:hypothetical protein [Methanosarcina spelaei]|uniref:hypothetical protein n=1 Tax=Methanosarcina spelaei TaxID=1036679 RepID=UPI001FE57DCD|nr:hypothetical protein [Methanosarcina spelaei]